MTERESKNFKCPLPACQSLTQGQLSTAGVCRSSYAGEWYRSTIALEVSFSYKGFKVLFSPADNCTKEAGWGKCRYRIQRYVKLPPDSAGNPIQGILLRIGVPENPSWFLTLHPHLCFGPCPKIPWLCSKHTQKIRAAQVKCFKLKTFPWEGGEEEDPRAPHKAWDSTTLKLLYFFFNGKFIHGHKNTFYFVTAVQDQLLLKIIILKD